MQERFNLSEKGYFLYLLVYVTLTGNRFVFYVHTIRLVKIAYSQAFKNTK